MSSIPETFRLDGRVAVVTGAARGQGAAEARLLAAAGARVVVTDVLADQAQQVADEIGDAARACAHDVSDEGSWADVVGLATREFGRLDVLVNNAGIWGTAPIEQETVEQFTRIWRVNMLGVFLGIRAVIAPMRAAGGGSIVNISSTAGLKGIPRHGAYGATKWGVRGLTKVAALELGDDRIRVNSVHPGAIDTPMIERSVSRGEGGMPSVPLRRVGAPDEVAGLVLYLASDASAYVTGAEFAVDGGATAGIVPPPRTGS